jgi:aryl-alcohol dehydrogenase-like predicted oxidoreductase
MDIVELGTTGLRASRIGLGLAALGRPGYINLGHADDLGEDRSVAALEALADKVLDAAWEKGVRYFDAARSYGRAEEFLGRWLRRRGIGVDEMDVGSKWGYTYTADWRTDAEVHEVKDHSLAMLKRQIKESRANLGDSLRLYQIHSATEESGVLENGAVLDELARLKANGLRIGLTLSGEHQAATLEQALAIRRDGRQLFDCVQATWNILEPSAGAQLADAHAAGMGVIVKEALANGRLTSRNQEQGFAANHASLVAIAEEAGVGIDAVAIAAALAQPWAHVVLSGAAQAEHLHSNLQALRLRLDAHHLAELSGSAEPPADYWQRRAELAWN